MNQLARITAAPVLPAIIASADDRAQLRFVEFFAVTIRNPNTRKAYAFLTCEPNPLVGVVHPKAMPVILHPENFDRWLSSPIADALELAAPYPSQLMVMN